MIDTLLKEEKMIVNCLQRYHTLRREQLIKLIQYKGLDVAQRIIKGLEKKQIIISDGGSYFSADIKCSVDDDLIKAFWVLLEFSGRIEKNAHYKAHYPANIRFLSDNMQYEIIVIDDEKEYLLNMIFETERDSSPYEEDIPVYLIVIPDVDNVEDCVKRIPASYISSGHVLFATVYYKHPSDDYPQVSFFSTQV